jgi:hypothetical protein
MQNAIGTCGSTDQILEIQMGKNGLTYTCDDLKYLSMVNLNLLQQSRRREKGQGGTSSSSAQHQNESIFSSNSFPSEGEDAILLVKND